MSLSPPHFLFTNDTQRRFEPELANKEHGKRRIMENSLLSLPVELLRIIFDSTDFQCRARFVPRHKSLLFLNLLHFYGPEPKKILAVLRQVIFCLSPSLSFSARSELASYLPCRTISYNLSNLLAEYLFVQRHLVEKSCGASFRG
jgi:hypothetical protein